MEGSASSGIQLGDLVRHGRSGIKGLEKTGRNKTYGPKEACAVDKNDAGNKQAKHVIRPGVSHTQVNSSSAEV